MSIQNLNLRKRLGMGKLLEADSGAGTNGADNGTGGEGSSGTDGTGEGAEGDSKSFDDILKGDKKYQSEFDKKIAKALETAKGKWETEYNTKLEDAKTEAQKLAKMNAQQKAEHERDKLQKELDKLRGEKARAEMAKEARRMCADANFNVSDDILSSIIRSDGDTTKEAVESFIELFKGEVEKAVKDALKGNSFKRGTGSNGGVTKEDIMKVADSVERQRLIREDTDLFN